MRDFFRRFNEVYLLIEAIDAGNYKEGTDTKIKRTQIYAILYNVLY